MDTSNLLQFFSELQQELDRLMQLQPKKVEAVRAHDLEQLNDCMKQEQALSLSLRGLEQRRDKLLQGLGLSGFSLLEAAQRCPADQRRAAVDAAEELRRHYHALRSAQEAARTVIEKDLRAINKQLEQRGILSEMDDGYSPNTDSMSKSMRTDFRA